MPLYEYECDACGCRFEVIQKFSDKPVETCAECGKGPVRKLLSSPAIQFKGSGWYITDYAQKGRSDSGSTTPASKSTGDTKSESSQPATDKGGASSDASPSSKPATGSSSKE
jgi:putative FmdB family regulatory protein